MVKELAFNSLSLSEHITSWLIEYISHDVNYMSCINKLLLSIDMLGRHEQIDVLSKSLRDICFYDIEDSSVESSNMFQFLVTRCISHVDFNAIASYFITNRSYSGR